MSGEAIDQFVIDFGIDDDAVGAHADLSLMQIPADNGSTHRVVHIGVVQNYAGGVPAKFERHALHARTMYCPSKPEYRRVSLAGAASEFFSIATPLLPVLFIWPKK
jgi:hypothetical protein